MSGPSRPEGQAGDEGLGFLAGEPPRPPATPGERLLLAAGHLLRAQQDAHEAELQPPDDLQLARLRRLAAAAPRPAAVPVRVALAAGLAGVVCGALLGAGLGLSLRTPPAVPGRAVVIPQAPAEPFSAGAGGMLEVVDLDVRTADPLAWAGALTAAFHRAGVPVSLSADGAQQPIVLEARLPDVPGAALTAVLRQAQLPVRPGAVLRLVIEPASS